MLTLTQRFITRNRTYSNPTRITVRGAILHSVGVGQTRAEIFISNVDAPTAAVSYHGIIEAGGRAFQLLPWNFQAWHVGGTGNNTHIGVEMTEPATIQYTGSGANFTDNNPAATEAHVRDTYATAVLLFAQICAEHDLNPLADGVILSHSEAHRRGIASNHADVEHLWHRFGLSMNNFRQDVATQVNHQEDLTMTQFEQLQQRITAIEDRVMPRYMKLEEIPVWGRDAIVDAMARGILRGVSDGNLNLSWQEVRAMVFDHRREGRDAE